MRTPNDAQYEPKEQYMMKHELFTGKVHFWSAGFLSICVFLNARMEVFYNVTVVDLAMRYKEDQFRLVSELMAAHLLGRQPPRCHGDIYDISISFVTSSQLLRTFHGADQK